MTQFKTTCDRCRATGRPMIMSKFNTDWICTDCKQDEKLAPGYAVADGAEFQACKRGERNFPGVGLSADDRAFLAARVEQRKVVSA